MAASEQANRLAQRLIPEEGKSSSRNRADRLAAELFQSRDPFSSIQPKLGVELGPLRAAPSLNLPEGPDPVRMAGQFAAGVPMGFADLVDFLTDVPGPVPRMIFDAQNLGTRLRGKPTSFRDALEAGFEAMGVPQPENFAERVANRIGEEAGAAAGPSGALFGIGRQAVRSGRPLPGLLGNLAERSARRPKLFATEEIASSVGAGTGRATAEEAGGGAGTQALVGMAGGIAPVSGLQAVRGVGRIGRAGVRLAREQLPQRASRRLAQETLQSSVGSREEALRALERAEFLRAEVPGVEFSLSAIVPNSPLLRTLENTLSASDPVLARNLALAHSRGSAATRRALIELAPPENTVDAAQDAARAFVDREIEAAIKISRRERGRLISAIEKAGGTVDPVDLDVRAGRTLERAAEEFTKASSNDFAEVGRLAARANARISTFRLKESRLRVIRETGKFEKSLLPSDVMEDIKELGKTVSFDDLQSLDRKLNALWKAADDAGNRPLKRILSFLRGGLNESFDQFGKVDSVPQSVRSKYQAAKASFAEGASRFREGEARRLLKNQGGVIHGTLGRFVAAGPRGVGMARQFKRTFADRPAVLSDMSDYLVAKALAGVIEPDGNVNAKRAQTLILTFKKNYRGVLSEFPEVSKRLDNVNQLAEEARRLGIDNPTPRAQDFGVVGIFVDDPRRSVRQILNSSHPAREAQLLIARVGSNEQARRGLQRVFYDEIFSDVFRTRSTPSQLVSGIDSGDLAEILQTRRPLLNLVFGRDQVNRMELIAEAASGVESIPVVRTGRQAPSQENLMRSLGPLISAPIFSPRQRVFRMGLRILRAMEAFQDPRAKQIVEEAIMNPDLAKELLSADTIVKTRRFYGRFGVNLPTLPERVQQERRP